MEHRRIGFAFCGSFCTYDRAMAELARVKERFGEVIPIVSPIGQTAQTRFGNAADFIAEMERICGRQVISSIPMAEPIGPRHLLDAVVICPCTGNTLAKLACGITDTAVTMAAKSQLRNGGPLVLAVSTNDGLTGSAKNIGTLLDKKNVYFVPFRQDDPIRKPASLVAEFSLVGDTLAAALEGYQQQPLLLS